MISKVKQCLHLNAGKWTETCLLKPRTCSVSESAEELGLRKLGECVETIFTSKPHFKVGNPTTFYDNDSTHWGKRPGANPLTLYEQDEG